MNQSATKHVESIRLSAMRIFETIPSNITVVAAVKGRTLHEVEAVIQSGITHIGYNYVQEAQLMIPALEGRATCHMIGHLQRNKAKKAVQLFDVIETVDSLYLALAIDRRCAAIGKIMPILVEINSGEEPQKSGVLPESVDELVAEFADLKHISIQGLMTMGPRFGDPENARPFFRATRKAFEHLSNWNLPNIDMRYLSMGMSNSYLVAIDEGANIVRIGTKIFGSRSD